MQSGSALMGRRLQKRIALIFAALALLVAQILPASPPQPDILLIMPDQMRGDCLSLLGHPAVHTPHLDVLARQGALFRRAYSTCPSCIPARYALLSGLFPATSGVVGYKARPISYPTLPRLLADAGYTTILDGRYMHQLPEHESYGYQKEVRGSTYVADDDYDHYLRAAAPDTGGIRALVDKLGLSFNGWEAKPWPLADDLHPTAWIVRQARQTLRDVPAERPLFLTASFFAPHPPLFPPRQYFAAALTEKLPAPAHGDWVNWPALSPKGNRQGDRVLLEGETLRATQAGYFGLIHHLDDQLASLIAEFQEWSRKAQRPWIILLTSDHGEMLGDHGFFRKCEPFEGSANIPLVIAGSSSLGFRPGLRSLQPVCLEDIMPTLLELAGAPAPKPMDGISLVRTLRGENATVREWLHSEHAPCYNQPQAFHALTDGHLKYIWRPLDGTEYLFDLDQDIREEHDLSKAASHRKLLESCRARLVKVLNGRPEGFSDGTKLITGRPYPPLQERSGDKTRIISVSPARSVRPNLILYLSDDHGVDFVGCYGNAAVRTPNIDSLARQGMKFNRVFAASPTCSPSRAAMFTGLWPQRNGAMGNHTDCRPGTQSLAGYLQALGYRVVAANKTDVRPASVFGWELLPATLPTDPRFRRYRDEGLDTGQVDAFIGEHLRAHPQQPLCLLLGDNGPHVVWETNKIYDPALLPMTPLLVDTPKTRLALANYYQDITTTDQRVGEVLASLKRHGLETNTIFIYTTDQGPEWPRCKWTLYDSGLRVPFIVRWPGVLSPGSECDALISLVDLTPTFVTLAGGKPPGDLDGVSFADVLLGRSQVCREALFATHTGDGTMNMFPQRAVRDERFKYILNLHPEREWTTHFTKVEGIPNSHADVWKTWIAKAEHDASTAHLINLMVRHPAEELYDTRADPYELTNLVERADLKPVLQGLRQRLEDWRRNVNDF